MIYGPWPKMLTALLFGFAVYFISGGTLAARRLPHPTNVALDQLIPREYWTGTGLDKLTAPEQQTLAGEITALLQDTPPAQNAVPGGKDRSQWRKLQKHMSKDDVRKLLGEPFRVSVSRYYEYWEYVGGTVLFDGKGHLDFWSET